MAKERLQVSLACDWGVRPPLWGGSTPSQTRRWRDEIERLRREGRLVAMAPAPGEVERGLAWRRSSWPLPLELLDRLDHWAARWERLTQQGIDLDHNAPLDAVDDDRELWDLDGLDLAEELQRRLGPGWEVLFRSRWSDDDPGE